MDLLNENNTFLPSYQMSEHCSGDFFLWDTNLVIQSICLYSCCVPLVVSTSRSFPHSWLHQWSRKCLPFKGTSSSPLVLSGVRVTRSLVSCAYFVDRYLSFCLFSIGHCDVYPSSINGSRLPLWFLQAFFMINVQLVSLEEHYCLLIYAYSVVLQLLISAQRASLVLHIIWLFLFYENKALYMCIHWILFLQYNFNLQLKNVLIY